MEICHGSHPINIHFNSIFLLVNKLNLILIFSYWEICSSYECDIFYLLSPLALGTLVICSFFCFCYQYHLYTYFWVRSSDFASTFLPFSDWILPSIIACSSALYYSGFTFLEYYTYRTTGISVVFIISSK